MAAAHTVAGASSAGTAEREIVLTREFGAPRELVWQAWTDPEHFPRWFGPNGFTTTLLSMDVRPGGTSRYTMRGPDGTDYPNRVVYQEVVRPERLVYLLDDDVDDGSDAFHVTVTFEEENGRTRLTQRMLFATAEQREGVVSFGAIELGRQTLERLAEHLRTM